MVRKFLVSGVMIDDEYEDTVIGTPQGGNISPLLANIMTNKLDKELEARGLNFVRYADDLVIMVGSRQAAEQVMKNICMSWKRHQYWCHSHFISNNQTIGRNFICYKTPSFVHLTEVLYPSFSYHGATPVKCI